MTRCPKCDLDLSPLALARRFSGEAMTKVRELWHRAWGGKKEVGKIECPSCGKSTNWRLDHCEHCTEAVNTMTMLTGSGAPLLNRIKPNPSLSPDNISDFPTLASYLFGQGDSLSKYIFNKLTKETQKSLGNYQTKGELNPRLRGSITAELNRLIQGPLIFSPKRFAGISLAESTQRQILRKPTGKELQRLNLSLLCEAIPNVFQITNPKRWRKPYLVLSVLALLGSFYLFEQKFGSTLGLGPQLGFFQMMMALMVFAVLQASPVFLPVSIIIAFLILLVRLILPKAAAVQFFKRVPVMMRLALALNFLTILILLITVGGAQWSGRLWLIVLILGVVYSSASLFNKYLYPTWEGVEKAFGGERSPFKSSDAASGSGDVFSTTSQQGRTVRKN